MTTEIAIVVAAEAGGRDGIADLRLRFLATGAEWSETVQIPHQAADTEPWPQNIWSLPYFPLPAPGDAVMLVHCLDDHAAVVDPEAMRVASPATPANVLAAARARKSR